MSLFLFSLTRARCPAVQGVAIVTDVRVAPGAGGGVCVAQLLPHGHHPPVSHHSDPALLCDKMFKVPLTPSLG